MFEAAAGQELAPDRHGNVRKMHRAVVVGHARGERLPARGLDDLAALRVAGRGGFDTMAFEEPCSTGLGGTAPHPDVVLTGRDGIAAVESKLLEPLSPKTAAFSHAYRASTTRAARAPGSGCWTRTSRSSGGSTSRSSSSTRSASRAWRTAPRLHLEYVWWEPTDAATFAVYREHRAELARFGLLVGGDAQVSFGACTHADLWAAWLADDPPSWLPDHVGRLQSRYARTLTVISGPTPSTRVIDLDVGGTR
jgi:hypothetical protein